MFHGSNGFDQDCEMVLVAVGVKPNAALGTEAGLETGVQGRSQGESQNGNVGFRTSMLRAIAAETFHGLLNRNIYLPLGTTAHKQGRVAAENAMGGNREFAGSLGTQVVKVFDLVIARTGLRLR